MEFILKKVVNYFLKIVKKSPKTKYNVFLVTQKNLLQI